MKTKAQIDSYNSLIARYDPAAPSLNGTIVTNSASTDAIRIEGDGTIVKRLSGMNSNPANVLDLSGGAQVTGAQAALSKDAYGDGAFGLPSPGNYG